MRTANWVYRVIGCCAVMVATFNSDSRLIKSACVTSLSARERVNNVKSESFSAAAEKHW